MMEIVTMSFECQCKLANELNPYDLKKKLTPEIALTLPWGYIHVYYHSSQTSLLVYISGLR